MGRKASKTPTKAASAKKKKATPKKYVVEKILDKRRVGRTLEYLIKWKNYSNDENSWEPAINCECPDVIRQFEKEQKAALTGKKRSAAAATDASPGPSAKRSRTGSKSVPLSKRSRTAPPAADDDEEEDTPRSQRVSTTPTTHYRTRTTTSAGILKLNKSIRAPSTVPQLITQRAANPSSSAINYSTSDEREDSSTAGAGIDTIDDASSPSSSPEVKPVIVTRCKTTVVREDDNVASTDAQQLTANLSYQKTMTMADNNVKMAQELIKCPDLFYVYTSLGILKNNLDENRNDLLAEIQELQGKDDIDAGEMVKISDKIGDIKKIYDEINSALDNLHPSSRLDHVSLPQDSDDNREVESESPVQDVIKVEPGTPVEIQVVETALNSNTTTAPNDDEDTAAAQSNPVGVEEEEVKDESLPEPNNENLDAAVTAAPNKNVNEEKEEEAQSSQIGEEL